MTSITGLRYVTPLFELAREKGVLEDVDRSLKSFSRLLEETPELREILLNPMVPAEKKKALILRFTQHDPVPLADNFYRLLVDKQREEIFLHMEQTFTRLLDRARGVAPAVVQTPVPLDETFKAALAEQLGKRTGTTVRLTEEIRPELIGGARIIVGSRMLDGTLRARLEGMRRHLLEAARVE